MYVNDWLVLQGNWILNVRMVLTDYRKSMTPYTFLCIMTLKINRDLWGIKTIQEILKLDNNI
jgi:hypothetical protein